MCCTSNHTLCKLAALLLHCTLLSSLPTSPFILQEAGSDKRANEAEVKLEALKRSYRELRMQVLIAFPEKGCCGGGGGRGTVDRVKWVRLGLGSGRIDPNGQREMNIHSCAPTTPLRGLVCVEWSGAVRCGVLCCAMLRCAVLCCAVLCCGKEWNGIVWYGPGWTGLGLAWLGLA